MSDAKNHSVEKVEEEKETTVEKETKGEEEMEKTEETPTSEKEEPKTGEDTPSQKTDDQKVEDSAAAAKDDREDKQEDGDDCKKEKKDFVVFKFRDKNKMMVKAWREAFKDYEDRIEISHGDIFRGAPAADALVSPANSFGFMDGGIDMAYSMHFGWQMQKRLQKVIREEKHGEVLVGDAVIIPTFEGGDPAGSMDWSKTNEGQPIKLLVSAPTMRMPMNVHDTVNAYLAFRAVILAVQAHNRDPSKEKITSVLTPGLGTAVGRMPVQMCAYQMLQAYETFELGLHPTRIAPDSLWRLAEDHDIMTREFDK